MQKSLHDTTWRLEQVVRQNVIERDKTMVLVDMTSNQRQQPDAQKALDLLASLSRVINIQDEPAAEAEFAAAANLLHP